MTQYALRHIASKRWLGLPPSKGVHMEVTQESRAFRFDFMSIAEAERLTIDHFPDAYEVVLVEDSK